MKKYILLGSALLMSFALALPPSAFAAGAPQMANLKAMLKDAKATHAQLNVAQGEKLIASEKNLLVVDVREPAEFQARHIPGAINIPRGVLEFQIAGKVKDINRPILIYCRTGLRGSLAGQSLRKLGYTKVSNLAGGFVAWEYEGYAKSPLGKKWFEGSN